MSDRLSINQWAEEDRPREKMAEHGAAALTNAELLAILIGSGSQKESAVELMKRILKDCDNSLNRLGRMSIRELTDYNGIGEAKAISILAACELGKRRQGEPAEERPELSTATRVYNYMHPKMQDLDVEEFWILLLNQDFRLIKAERIAHGGISEVSVDVRILIREAVLNNATMICAVHNHPSGAVRPSKPDDNLTQTIANACQLMRLHFMDHVIIGNKIYYSYKEENRL